MLLGLVIYVYSVEVERRRWEIVLAGLAFWLMDGFAVRLRRGAAGGDRLLPLGLLVAAIDVVLLLVFGLAGWL